MVQDEYKVGDIVMIELRIKGNKILPKPIDVKAKLVRTVGSRSFICVYEEDGTSFVRNVSQMTLVSKTIDLTEIYYV